MITVTMHKPNDPKSKAIKQDEPFIIAIGYAGDIRAIESQPDIHKAQHARDNLAEHQKRTGRDPNAVRIFRAQDVIWSKS